MVRIHLFPLTFSSLKLRNYAESIFASWGFCLDAALSSVVSGKNVLLSGSSSVGRASAFQAECRGFESRLPLTKSEYANVAQLVEHIHGKDEVTSSILVIGS